MGFLVLGPGGGRLIGFGGGGGAEFGHGGLFDLADAFFGEAEASADLLVGGGDASVEAVVSGEDVAFARIEPREEGLYVVAVGELGEGDTCSTFGDLGEHFGVAGVGGGCGEEFGDGSSEAFHEGESGIGAEAVAACDIEAVDSAHENQVAFADEFEESEVGAGVFSGDADDEPQVGLDDGVFGFLRLGEVVFKLADMPVASQFGVEAAATSDKLGFVEAQFEEDGSFFAFGEEGRAVEVLEIGRQIAWDAEFFASGFGGEFFLGEDGLDGGGGIVVVVEGIVVEADFAAGEPVDAVVEDGAIDGGLWAAELGCQLGDGCTGAIGVEYCGFLVWIERRWGVDEDGFVGMFLVVFSDGMEDCQGGAFHASSDSAGDFGDVAGLSESAAMADDLVLLVGVEEGEIA